MAGHISDESAYRSLATRQRSKSLSVIDVTRRPVYHATAPRPAQECTAPVDDPFDVSRCACGRLLPFFAPEPQQKLDLETPVATVGTAEDEESQVNAGAEEKYEVQVDVDMRDQYEVQVDVDTWDQTSSSDEEDVEYDSRNAQEIQHWLDEAGNDAEDSDTHSFDTCIEELEDETTSQKDHWSSTSPPMTSPSHPPLPSPNRLTSAYLPFTSHRALTNHLSSSKISSHLTNTTPLFLHSTLQLPSTLCQVLEIRLPTILRRLTPAVLLQHTTDVNPQTLLPSVVEVKTISAYHHVQGLLFFAPNYTFTPIHDMINEFYQAQAKCEMKKVYVQIEDAERKRQSITAWAWVSEEQGVEEWWTVEDFVGGKVVGLGAVKW